MLAFKRETYNWIQSVPSIVVDSNGGLTDTATDTDITVTTITTTDITATGTTASDRSSVGSTHSPSYAPTATDSRLSFVVILLKKKKNPNRSLHWFGLLTLI